MTPVMTSQSRRIFKINLLGEVRVQDAPLPEGGQRIRRTIALLALNAARVITAETLGREFNVDEHSKNGTSQLFSRIRGLGLPVRACYPGWSLEIDPKEVDCLCLIREVDLGHRLLKQGDIMAAETTLTGALAIATRGAFLETQDCGLILQPWAQAIAERQQKLTRALYRLALLKGDADIVVEDICWEWRLSPEREDLAALAVLALYRCMRTIEVSEVFEATKMAMAEFGLHPAQLDTLVVRMLRNDPELLDHSKMPF